ncbi:MAG TPA: MFS transporter [Verrucomicrobiae bacterium]|jgi:MFS family permease|nr:MFS transporter [Verrucomicrobiae bacterium]
MNLPRASFYAWAVVAMLFPVALLNYLDRMMVATMRESIRADIPTIASDADFGFLMALFMWVYAFLSPIGGYLADRFNRRWMVILSLLIWSLMTWLTGHAHTFREMAWTRALMGMSEACYIPAALALIADFHPGATRSRAIGIHMCGIYAGQALGGVGGYIADGSSWRNAFYWFGAAGVGYAFFLMFALRDSQRQIADENLKRENVRFWRSTRVLLSSGAFLILVIYFTLPGIGGWAIKNWLPTFLAANFNLRQGPAGMSATGYVTFASFAGALLGGLLADRAMRFTPRGRIYVTAIGMALCAPALIGLGHAGSLGYAIVCMILFGLGFGFFDTNNMPILCQIVRPEYRATGYGIMNLIAVAAGAGVTVLMGAMRDRGISLGVVFTLCAAAALLGGLLILLVRPREEIQKPA